MYGNPTLTTSSNRKAPTTRAYCHKRSQRKTDPRGSEGKVLMDLESGGWGAYSFVVCLRAIFPSTTNLVRDGARWGPGGGFCMGELDVFGF